VQLKRENIVEEFERRMNLVTGVNYVARNPVQPPAADNVPAIMIYELTDDVEEIDMRGGSQYPNFRRSLTVVTESFVAVSEAGAASKEVMAFILEQKKALYEGGATLGGKCTSVVEVQASQILRPEMGENIAGMGLVFELRYIEDTGKLFP
jgi:hypothetical protein